MNVTKCNKEQAFCNQIVRFCQLQCNVKYAIMIYAKLGFALPVTISMFLRKDVTWLIISTFQTAEVTLMTVWI